MLAPVGPTAHTQNLDPPGPLSTTPVAGSDPSAGAAGWPCTSCAAIVSIELDVCPQCGGGFLGRLEDGGRHRSSSTNGISRLPRPARLAAGLVSGILIAVLIPVLLALLG